MSATATINTISELRKLADNSPNFRPCTTDKHAGVESYFYREHQLVSFFDKAGVESIEAKIIAKDFPVSPSAGRITKFSPKLLTKLEERHTMIAADLEKAAGSTMFDGFLMKPLADGQVSIFVSCDMPRERAERILAIITEP